MDVGGGAEPVGTSRPERGVNASLRLEVDELTIRMHGRPVVVDVSFAVGAGERVALLGASGSGKSLTARALVGQSLPGMTVSGQVRVSGRGVLGRPATRRRSDERIAMVFQDSARALHPLTTVRRQLLGAVRRSGTAPRAAAGRTAQLLTDVGLDEPGLADRVPSQLSGGQRQRVCLAMTLACRPAVMIADEPTTALDVVAQSVVLETLRTRVAADTSVLFITHDLAVATEVCDRAVVLAEGRVVEQGPLPTLLWDARHPCSRALCEAAYAQQLPPTATGGAA